MGVTGDHVHIQPATERYAQCWSSIWIFVLCLLDIRRQANSFRLCFVWDVHNTVDTTTKPNQLPMLYRTIQEAMRNMENMLDCWQKKKK